MPPIALRAITFQAGDFGGGRAEDQGRPGEDGSRALEAGGTPTFKVHTDEDSGRQLSAVWASCTLGSCGPHEARVQGCKPIGEAEGGLPRDDSEGSRSRGQYIRQTGGSGNYGHCWLRVEPNEPGKGYEFINEIKGGVVPKEYIKPIDMGVRGAMEGGILAGFPMVDVKVALFDGSYHEVDSNENAFKIAGSVAFKEAAHKAKPVLLEPVMAVEVTVPEEFMGVIIGDINSRRGRIEGMEHAAGSQVIKAMVPLKEMFGYVNEIRSSTQGRASYSMQFARYEEAPRMIADEIIGRAQGK